MKKRIAVAMSGGIDSSVAVALLKDRRHDVVGLTARMWAEGSRCCSDEDIREAQRVADWLSIPHYVVDLHEQFEKHVVDYFAAEYAAGRTPSPCVVCNRTIKFGALLEKALTLGSSHLATGHYARVETRLHGTVHLLRGIDKEKDQSYFLFDLSQDQLRRTMFPLGEMTKSETLEYAHACGMPVAQRGESQDLCFVQPGEHHVLVEKRRPGVKVEGRIVDTNGADIGSHDGIHRFTVGQRRGLGVATGKPMYVVKLDAASNTVVVGSMENLLAKRAVLNNVRWSTGKATDASFHARAKIRYGHLGAYCFVSPVAGQGALLTFEEPQFAVTPGQAAVFYVDDELVGGGWIEKGE